MEHAAIKRVALYLPEWMDTVGTSLDIKHLAASPLRVFVRIRVLLRKREGNHLLFKVEVFERTGQVSKGSHEPFVFERAAFLARCEAKQLKSIHFIEQNLGW